MMAADLSCLLGWLKAEDVIRIENLLQRAKLPTRAVFGLQCEALLAAMAVDKKVVSQTPRFVLLKRGNG